MIASQNASTNPIREVARDDLAGLLNRAGLAHETLAGDEGLVDALLELVDLLKSCQEEGEDLRPHVCLFREHDQEKLGSKLGTFHFFEIAEGDRTRETFKQAVKTCAPLAHGVWAIFIKLGSASIKYGVMRRRYSVLGPALLPLRQSAPPFIWIRQIERHLLELRGPNADVLEIDFRVGSSGTQVESSHSARTKLLDHLVRDVWESKKDAVRSVLEEVLDGALMRSHGFLIAITDSVGEKTEVPPVASFASGGGLIFRNWIVPTQLKVAELMKVRFQGTDDERAEVSSWKREDIAEELTDRYAEVDAWADLVSSMLTSDGITWLDTRGRVLGYRIFIKSGADERSGGARTRAFVELSKLVRTGELSAAFMQSQDGQARFVAHISSFGLMMAPGERPGELHELHLLPVEVPRDLRAPVVREEPELLREVHLVRHRERDHGAAGSRVNLGRFRRPAP